MNPARILLVDDHAMFRSGIRLVIESGLPGAEIIEAASMEQAARASPPPSLVLLDIQLQGLNGLEGLALLRRRWPQTPVIMLSSTAEPETVHLALTRGAAAFVCKADTAERIVRVIGEVLAGKHACAAAGDAQAESGAPPLLTPRQCEVLDLLCEGLSNKTIARRLELSEFTVRGHVQAVLNALGVTSRSQATFAARNRGLVGPLKQAG